MADNGGKKKSVAPQSGGAQLSPAQIQKLREARQARAASSSATAAEPSARPPVSAGAMLAELKKKVVLANQLALKYKTHAAKLTLLVKKSKLQSDKLQLQIVQLQQARGKDLKRLQQVEAEALAAGETLLATRAELEAAQAQRAELQQSVNHLEQQLREKFAEAARSETPNDSAETRAELQSLRSQLAGYNDQLADFQSHNEELTLALDQEKAEAFHFLEELEKARAECQRLQQSLTEEQRKLAEFEPLRQQLKEVQEVLRVKSADLDTSNALLMELEIDLHERDERLEKLQRELEGQAEASRASIEEQQLELEELRLLRDDAESDSKLVTSIQDSLDEASAQNRALLARIKSLESEVAHLESELTQVQAHSDSSEAFERDHAALFEQLEQVQAALHEREDELAAVLQQLEVKEEEAEALLAREADASLLAELERARDQLQQQLDQRTAELEKAQQGGGQRSEYLREELDRTLDQLSEARGQLKQAEEQEATSRKRLRELEMLKDAQQKHIDDIEAELKSSKERARALEQSESKLSEQRDELTHRLHQLDRDLAEAREQLRQNATPSGELSPELQKKLERLEKKAAQSEQQLVETRARLLEAHNELEPLDNRRARAEAKVTILQRELGEALEQVQTLEEKLKLYEPDPPRGKGRKGRS